MNIWDDFQIQYLDKLRFGLSRSLLCFMISVEIVVTKNLLIYSPSEEEIGSHSQEVGKQVVTCTIALEERKEAKSKRIVLKLSLDLYQLKITCWIAL